MLNFCLISRLKTSECLGFLYKHSSYLYHWSKLTMLWLKFWWNGSGKFSSQENKIFGKSFIFIVTVVSKQEVEGHVLKFKWIKKGSSKIKWLRLTEINSQKLNHLFRLWKKTMLSLFRMQPKVFVSLIHPIYIPSHCHSSLAILTIWNKERNLQV